MDMKHRSLPFFGFGGGGDCRAIQSFFFSLFPARVRMGLGRFPPSFSPPSCSYVHGETSFFFPEKSARDRQGTCRPSLSFLNGARSFKSNQLFLFFFLFRPQAVGGVPERALPPFLPFLPPQRTALSPPSGCHNVNAASPSSFFFLLPPSGNWESKIVYPPFSFSFLFS